MLSSRPAQLPTDGAHFPARTPGRALKNRAENAHAGGAAATINGKLGKHAVLAGGAPAFPKTPFQSAAKHGKQRIHLASGRPLGDKTPLPNRFAHALLLHSPLAGGGAKPLKIVPHRDDGIGAGGDKGEGGGTPDSAQRPSSLRKHPKHPRNSGAGRFETPVNSGRHWDASDGEIVLPEVVQETDAVVEENDTDEVEYGAPNTLDLPYCPPFDFALPDYAQVGRTLAALVHAPTYDEIVVPDFGVAALESPVWERMALPELESDDPFALARKESLPPAPLPPAKTKLANPLAKGPRALSTTRAAAPRVGASRSVSTTRLAPSDSATSTRSHPAAAASRLRTASSAAATTTTTTTTTKALANTTVKALPAARAKAPLTSVPKNPALTRPGSSSSVARAALEKKALAGKATERRRPHTSTAVMRAKPKATAAVDGSEGIVFGAGLGDEIGEGEEFLFDI